MKKKSTFIALLILFCTPFAKAQEINQLVEKVKAKLETVNDYEATGKLKTNVTFLKVPIANIKMYYKRPDRLKIKNEKGISFVPKGAVSINLNTILR